MFFSAILETGQTKMPFVLNDCSKHHFAAGFSACILIIHVMFSHFTRLPAKCGIPAKFSIDVIVPAASSNSSQFLNKLLQL